MLSRIEEVRVLAAKLHGEERELLVLLAQQVEGSQRQEQRLDAMNRRLDSDRRVNEAILAFVQKLFHSIIELKQMMMQVVEALAQLQIWASSHMSIRGLDPTAGLPIILEDALGYILPIPLEWVEDWEVRSHRKEKLALRVSKG